MAGAYDVVVAAGVEVMSLVPMGASAMVPNVGLPFGPSVGLRYEPVGGLVPQGISAEMIADKWDLSREDLDAFGARSQQTGGQGHRGRPLRAGDRRPWTPRSRTRRPARSSSPASRSPPTRASARDTTAETLAKLKPAFKPDGKVTAGNSLADHRRRLRRADHERGEGRRRSASPPGPASTAFALAGVDPVMMLTGPIPATHKVLERAKLTLDDIDLVEINEAFASVVLAWEKEQHPDMDQVNVNGGAIALGHPLGCSGTKLMATLLNELERTGGRYGLQTMCEGGGMANATIIERLG